MKLKKKLRSRRGETLAETLVAVLVVALTSAALAGMIGAAHRINGQVLEEDEGLYAGLQAVRYGTADPAETRLTEAEEQVSVKIGTQTRTVDVTLRSWEDSLFYYEWKDPAASGTPGEPGVTP